MENASKAMIIAGGVFVAIVVLVIAIELFVGYRNVVNNYYYTTTITEITEINRKFTKYEGKSNTIHDVVSAIKTAQNYNDKYGNGEQIIDVKIDGASKISNNNNDLTELIKDNLSKDKITKYKVKVEYYNKDETYSGLVKIINFEKIP